MREKDKRVSNRKCFTAEEIRLFAFCTGTLFDDMAKKSSVVKTRISQTDIAISLFDRDNLEFLDALRYKSSRVSMTPQASPKLDSLMTVHSGPSNADRLFEQCKVDDNDERWGMGELNVQIIHRGRIRISRGEWHQVIGTCSDGFIENGIRKDFHLNILQHPSHVRLIYISYRYKQSGDKQKEHRRGILVDETSNIQELMIHLAYWFTAQPHAEKNYAVWKALVDKAMTKLASAVEQ
jgi:hypothetical protein